MLLLDGAPHSYVDLDDPTHLEYAYAKAVVSVIDTAYAPGTPLRAYHIGGGGLTVPRYLAQVRPGTASLVSEIDAGVVRIDTERLALPTDAGIEIRVEDARLGLRPAVRRQPGSGGRRCLRRGQRAVAPDHPRGRTRGRASAR